MSREDVSLDKKFRSILDELNDYVPLRDRDHFIESRAQQVLASFAHLQTLIQESFDPTLAEELQRRLLLAAKSGDDKKFVRKLREARGKKGTNDDKKA
jgi:uncharacterized protein (UPF0305 family)